jgi:hypothetical protein
MSRRLWIAIAFAGAATLTYLILFRPNQEASIRRQVASLGEAVGIEPAERDPRVRPLRIQRTFERILAPSLRVNIEGVVEDVHRRDELAAMATSAAETYGDLTVTFDDVRVQLDDRCRFARVEAEATLAGADHDGNREHEEREVVMGLEKIDGDWRITALSTGAAGAGGLGVSPIATTGWEPR